MALYSLWHQAASLPGPALSSARWRARALPSPSPLLAPASPFLIPPHPPPLLLPHRPPTCLPYRTCGWMSFCWLFFFYFFLASKSCLKEPRGCMRDDCWEISFPAASLSRPFVSRQVFAAAEVADVAARSPAADGTRPRGFWPAVKWKPGIGA